tara:strand:- start:5 stop:1246 length:1242 start_codon:yes stop_codon:yes gene_type:complete
MSFTDKDSGIKFKKPNITVKHALDYWNNISKGKNPIKPRFYIKYGPPASGKSLIMKSVTKKDNIDENDIISIDVDDIIKSNKDYQDDIAKIEASGKSQEEKNKLKILLYFSWRSVNTRDSGFNKTFDFVGGGDLMSDLVLDNALNQRFNIEWETTGGSVNWTIREIRRIKNLGYSTVLVYPLVPLQQLIERVRGRTTQTNASDEQIKQNSFSALTNIKYIVNEVDSIYIYDNSNTTGSVTERKKIIVEIQNKWDGGWGEKKEGAHYEIGLTRFITRDEDYTDNNLQKNFPELYPYIKNLFKSANAVALDISTISLITTINKLASKDAALNSLAKQPDKLHTMLQMTEELYTTLDSDHNGIISEEEFKQWWSKYKKEINKEPSVAIKKSGKRSKKKSRVILTIDPNQEIERVKQ